MVFAVLEKLDHKPKFVIGIIIAYSEKHKGRRFAPAFCIPLFIYQKNL